MRKTVQQVFDKQEETKEERRRLLVRRSVISTAAMTAVVMTTPMTPTTTTQTICQILGPLKKATPRLVLKTTLALASGKTSRIFAGPLDRRKRALEGTAV